MIIQGTPEWFEARRGKVTASMVAAVIAKTKSGPSASRATYMGQLIAENLTGNVQESFSNAAMQWGTDTEPQARLSYEFEHGVEVIEEGFVIHPTILGSGASPDGMVGDKGMVEIKCPNTSTHIDTLLKKKVPGKYNTQMQFQMACCEREWTDFLSYDPRLPPHLQMFCTRVERDDKYINELESEVEIFIAEMASIIEELEKL
tara:strand:- start:697 stop:1305 length:609 start_codon:yes stop_codon:yes gene_type:complete